MHTSAGALRQLLLDARDKVSGRNLAIRVTKHLGLNPETDLDEGVARTRKLAQQVLHDIQNSSFDADAKKALEQSYDKFVYLIEYSLYSKDISDLQSGIFSEQHINSLYTIDMALDGKLNHYSDEEEQTEIVKIFIDAQDCIIASKLPNSLKNEIVKQINKIICALNNFRIFGVAGLKDSLEVLVGYIVLETDENTKKSENNILKKLSEAIGRGTEYLNKASRATKDGTQLIESGKKIAGMISDFSDKAG